MSTRATPFMLVYGTEAVLPVEIELPSLRITAAANLTPDVIQYAQNRIAALEVLDEERCSMEKKLRKYHGSAPLWYNQHLRLKKFKEGTLVLCNIKEVRANLPMPKFAPSWEGPYVIKVCVGKGCYDLVTPEGDDLFRVNAKYLKTWRDLVEGGHVDA